MLHRHDGGGTRAVSLAGASWALPGVLVAAQTIAGCGFLLGIDEFKDQQPSTDGGGAGGGDAGGGGGTNCMSPADCPSGAHGVATCEQGSCGLECDDGFADCDGSFGCETSTTDDRANCGGCGVVCSTYCGQSTCNDPVEVAAGYNHTCAVLKDGSLWCWGFNRVGEVGDGTFTDRIVPTRIALPGPVIKVAGGGYYYSGIYVAHTCALLDNGTAFCWGANEQGQLGNGSTTSSEVPIAVPLIGVKHIAVGGAHTCAVATNNAVVCWGANVYGQVGSGNETTVLSPVPVASSVAGIAAGALHTCAVKINGTLQCWGSNSGGQLGVGPLPDQHTPTNVGGLPDVVDVAAGKLHTCARSVVGSYCWGNSAAGQLGLGDLTSHDAPQPVGLPGVSRFALGDYHSSALAGRALYLWGENADGQLGDGTAVDALGPKDIGLAGVTAASLGEKHSCALTDAGALFCWGANTYGQLGDGTAVPRTVPTRVVWP